MPKNIDIANTARMSTMHTSGKLAEYNMFGTRLGCNANGTFV